MDALFIVTISSASTMAAPPPPGARPCAAPAYRKIGEFDTPACGQARGETVKISGHVLLTDRRPDQIKQAVVIRKLKVLAFTSVAASKDDPNATDISFEYSEPASSYDVPIYLIIVPTCGPVLNIPVDRLGRCGQ
jgi:hypothetical protein